MVTFCVASGCLLWCFITEPCCSIQEQSSNNTLRFHNLLRTGQRIDLWWNKHRSKKSQIPSVTYTSVNRLECLFLQRCLCLWGLWVCLYLLVKNRSILQSLHGLSQHWANITRFLSQSPAFIWGKKKVESQNAFFSELSFYFSYCRHLELHKT